MNQQKKKDSGHTYLSETLGSSILDSGASETVSGAEWFERLMETIPENKETNFKGFRRSEDSQI